MFILFCALSSKFEAMFVVRCLSDLGVSSACPHLLLMHPVLKFVDLVLGR